MTENGLSSGLPLVTNVTFAALGSLGIDYWLRNSNVSRTTARRTATLLGLVPAILLVSLFTYVESLSDWAIPIFTIVYGLSAFAIICRDPVLVDMAPLMAGTLHGVIDTIYSLGGIVVPILCNALVYYDADMERTWTSVWALGYGSLALWLGIYMTTVKSEKANFTTVPLVKDNEEDEQLIE